MTVIERPVDLVPRPKTAVVGLLIIWALFLVSRNNYLLFHTAAEGFAIIVAALIYVLATKTYKHSGNNFLLFLGNAYFFIGILDFFHLITYYGMGVLPADSPNPPTQLWIAGRYLEALSIFSAPFFVQRKFSSTVLFWIYAVVTGLLLTAILGFQVFPVCFVQGKGLTTFKIVSEYIICLIIVGAILHLYLRQQQIGRTVYLKPLDSQPKNKSR